MAKFKDLSLDLETGEHIDFDDDDTIKMGYDGSELYINSTVSGVRAAQPYHMVRYDQLQEAVSGTNEFTELTDTPATYSGYAGATVMVNMYEDGLVFVPNPPGTIVSGTTPPISNDLLWYNNNDNNIYYYDDSRSKWLTVFTHNYLFTYSGNLDGLYLSIGNVVDSYAHYHILRDATITAVTADQGPGSAEPTKGYEIQANGINVFSFNMVDDEYTNESMNVDISADDSLQMYCTGVGARARDPIITLELKWRYSV